MPSNATHLKISIIDLPEVRALIAELIAERYEWEERYWDLLAEHGGTT